MDLVTLFLDARDAGAVSALAEAGFSSHQARRFIPEAIRDLATALPTQNLEGLLNADSAQQTSRLLAAVDIPLLAARLGIGADMAIAGGAALIPRLLGLVEEQGLATLLDMLQKTGAGTAAELAKRPGS